MIALQIPSMISLANAVKNLVIVNSISPDTNSDPIINVVSKYTNHPSIGKIIAEEQNDSFSFEFTSVEKVCKEIKFTKSLKMQYLHNLLKPALNFFL